MQLEIVTDPGSCQHRAVEAALGAGPQPGGKFTLDFHQIYTGCPSTWHWHKQTNADSPCVQTDDIRERLQEHLRIQNRILYLSDSEMS